MVLHLLVLCVLVFQSLEARFQGPDDGGHSIEQSQHCVFALVVGRADFCVSGQRCRCHRLYYRCRRCAFQYKNGHKFVRVSMAE
jgi:hypothetical protein